MGFDNTMWHLDEGVTGLFGQWNFYTTAIVTLLVSVITFQIYTRRDPDIHPMLLARQAQGSPVRQEGESSIYRSQAAPHGMPLNSGLNVKEPGASKWARGRDGDIRDVWRKAVNGTAEGEGTGPGGKGQIFTVLGKENVVKHSLDDITRQINLVGQHILNQGGNRVAIYLPNSVELLATIFACSFYNLTAIILPFDESDEAVISMLRRSAADTVVTAPGSFPFDTVVKAYPSLRQLVWVVDEGSKHLDWNEVPQGTGSRINVSTWQDIVAEQPQSAGLDLPPVEGQSEARDITVFWKSKPGVMEEMVRFTNSNLVSAIAAQLFAVPQAQRLSPADLFLPADSLANSHTLILTFAALFSNASIAFNAAAAGAPNLSVAIAGIAPTVLVATPAACLATHSQTTTRLASPITSTIHSFQTRSLSSGGFMPASSLLTTLNDAARPALGSAPGKLRLLYTAERAGAGTPALTSKVLSDLRIYTGARVSYALTAPKVAGAVAQTGFYDYRVQDDRSAHFGPPLTNTEYFLRDNGAHKVTDNKIEGEIIVRGPSVAGNEAALGVMGTIRDDNTLAYA